MSSTAVATLVKMLESLAEPTQDQVVEHLREYIGEMQSELEWDKQFKKTQKGLVVTARRAKREIAKGRAKPLDHDRL
jgi:hypothetical protein